MEKVKFVSLLVIVFLVGRASVGSFVSTTSQLRPDGCIISKKVATISTTTNTSDQSNKRHHHHHQQQKQHINMGGEEDNNGDSRADAATTSSSSSCTDQCILNYIQEMKTLGIQNGVDYETWQDTNCHTNRNGKKKTPISTHGLVFGAGPGTTATRSFALAVNLLGKDVVHYAAWRNGFDGKQILGWHETLERFRVEDFFEGFENVEFYHNISMNLDFAHLYNPTQAIFDHPVPMYATDILQAFPNAKVIMTHRDPAKWYYRRDQFCKGSQHKYCDVPYLLRPVNIHLSNLTEYQSVESFQSTERAIKCLVGPERYLQVDAWNPPKNGTGDWMPYIAEFLEVETPPQHSQCIVPRSPSHSLDCLDEGCKTCRAWMQRKRYIPL